MTWPPTRPVRRRLFGVVFLAVWVAGMYVMWGLALTEARVAGTPIPHTVASGVPASSVGEQQPVELIYLETTPVFRSREFGLSAWLRVDEDLARAFPNVRWRTWHTVPRGLAVAWIMTVVSSLILYVAWRAAVNAFTCAAGTCDACGYNLTGLAEPRCPECGSTRRGPAGGT